MGHTHPVTDTDACFEINTITRNIAAVSGKTALIQGDHNSERFTFELSSRYIEDHDMALCNAVQIHYINIDAATKEKNVDVYEVDDMAVSPEDENKVTLSWLVSNNATRYAGSLNFLVKFKCIEDDGKVSYVWNSGIFKGISISDGMDNGEAVFEEYSDILEAWRLSVTEDVTKSVLAKAIPSPDVAEVGQTIVVKEIDENGKPIAWEVAKLPSNDWKVIEGSGIIGGDEAVTGHMKLSPGLAIDGSWTEAIVEAQWVASADISSGHRLNFISGDHVFYESAPINTTKTVRRYHVLVNQSFSPRIMQGYSEEYADWFKRAVYVNPGGVGKGTANYAYYLGWNKAIGFYPHWWTVPAGVTVEWYGVIHYR